MKVFIVLHVGPMPTYSMKFPYETGLMKLITDFPGTPIDAVDNVTEGTKYTRLSGNLLKWWMTALTTLPLTVQCGNMTKATYLSLTCAPNLSKAAISLL